MRFSSALKYHLSNAKWPIIIFYIVIYSLLILLTVSYLLMEKYGVRGKVGGLDTASMIFLFIVGLNSFKSTFYMFVGNGISRKTMFLSFAAMAGIVSVGMAAIDSLTSLVVSQFTNYQPTMFQLFAQRYSSYNITVFGEGLLWMVFSYMAATMAGFFITTAYYRMNKAIKLLVSIGLPIFVFIVLPIIDAQLFNGAIYSAIGTAIAYCSGIAVGSPYIGMLTNTVLLGLFGTFAYLLMRRATVKM